MSHESESRCRPGEPQWLTQAVAAGLTECQCRAAGGPLSGGHRDRAARPVRAVPHAGPSPAAKGPTGEFKF